MSADPDRSVLTGPVYGRRTFDLSTDRSTEDTFETLYLTDISVITPQAVPDECYLRFGSPSNSRLDLRDFEGLPLRAQGDNPFGIAYLENPTGSTGTLEILYGIALVNRSTSGGSSPTVGSGFLEAVDSGTGSGNAATLTIGDGRDEVNILVDTSGAATLTVEVLDADGNWLTYDTVDYAGAVATYEAYSGVVSTGVRAYLDSNRGSDGLHLQAKGG